MATDIHDRAAVQARLWEELQKHPTGMLGLIGGAPHHFQPMTAALEREANRLWFFGYKDTDLTETAVGGHEAMFVLQREHDFYACIDGTVDLIHDPERIDRFWNPRVASWYPEGKEDPRLALLRLDARDAAVWVDDAGPVRFAFDSAEATVGASHPGEPMSEERAARERAMARHPMASFGSFAP